MKKRKQKEADLTILGSEKGKNEWWQNKYLWVSVFFSIGWLVFVVQYLSSSGWWRGRFDLAPGELVGGLGGLALPMVVFWLICAYFDRTDKMETEAQTLKSYLNELVYPTEEGAIYTRTLTDALRMQIKEFRGVFQEVNEETQAVRDDLKHWVRELSAVIKHANTKTVASIREIARHIQNIAAVTDVATKQSEKTSTLFSEQAAILDRVMGGTIKTTVGLSKTLENNAAEMRALVQELNQVNAQTTQSIASSTKVMQALDQSSAKIEESINLYETSARQQNARLFGNLEKVLSVFRAHGDLLEQEVSRTTTRLTGAENALKGQASALIKLTDQAVQRVDETKLVFNATKDELNTAVATFRTEAENVVEKLTKANKVMLNTPVVQKAKTGDLLQEAGTILSRLQDFSVDMAHLFEPKAEEELWERYYSGDKTVFMRHIRTELTPSKCKKMKELYEQNIGFKESVDKYMAAFENMTQMADKGDDSKLLMSIVIGSDVGRLYMVLANVLKGKN